MRLLVTTDFNPSSVGGGPAVIRQMLSGFREAGHEIHWWSCRPREKQEQPFAVDSLTRFPVPRNFIPTNRMTRLKTKFVRGIWAPCAAKQLQKTIAMVRPDCVWAIPHNWSILPLYNSLIANEKRRCRFHTTIQDYPDVHGNEHRWGAAVAEEMTEKQISLYAQAETRDATSLPMIEDLARRTGKQAAQMLHEGLEKRDFSYIGRLSEDTEARHPINIAHVGTILMERQFTVLTDALELLRNKGYAIRLDLWSAHSYTARPWFDAAWMTEHGHLEHRELIEGLKRCDWGLLVMSDKPKDARYNKFSFPTRCISYMAAGLPSLVWGLTDSAVALLVRDTGTGILLGTARGDSLAGSLEINLDPEMRVNLQARLANAAASHFDAEKMRRKLWKCLVSGAENN